MPIPAAAVGQTVGTLAGIAANIFGANQERDQQKEFAQKGIQWRVADATKAGLHPLAALGANTMSYSPVQVGDMVGPLADLGQNVGRSIEATANGTERSSGQIAALQLERAGLENDLLRTQIASTNAQLRAQIGPPMPTDGNGSLVIDGQGDTRRPPLKAFGMSIHPRQNESSAQEGENEYGEAADVIAAARLMRDADPVVTEMLRGEIAKARRGEPNILFEVKRTRPKGPGQWLSRDRTGPSSRPRLYYR